MKLIIISDLHFDENNDWNRINQISAQLINRIKMKMKDNEDVIFIILGDIINRAGIGDNTIKFAEASRFINDIKTNLVNAQFYFMPGNHEINNGKIVDEFHDFAIRHNTDHVHFSLDESVFSVLREDVNLILVDSTLERKHDSDGKIDVELLKKHMKSNAKNLVFIHHPPLEQDGADRSVEKPDELIATHANFIFYGHQHGYVIVPDFLQNDTGIHSVASMFKTKDGAKSGFLLLDIAGGKINYARRYNYIDSYYHSQLMYPKKENLLSSNLKLDKPKPVIYAINRKYKIILDKPEETLFSVFEKIGGVDECMLLQKSKLILLSSVAGMGKTYSLINMYNSMKDNEDYFPIWLSLGSANYETIRAHLRYAQYNTIDNKIPALFCDGLDEMQGKYIEDFVRDMLSATNGDAEVKVVISVRSNYIISIANSNFERFELMPLTNEDIKQIAIDHDIDTIQEFFKQIDVKNCNKLAENPFYLFEMVNIYKQNRALPEQGKLFEHMIKIRFRDGDQRSPHGCAKSLLENEFLLMSKLKKLSFFMSATQNYLLENIQYTEILSPFIREQFQKTGLIEKKEIYPEVFWTFEHRNFCEYLAAESLFNINFKDLIKVITCDKKCQKLRASWVNIIGFILLLRKNNDLTEWLLANAIDELCNLQPDSLSEGDRDLIFVSMFENCVKKDLPLYTKYIGSALTNYFGSEEIINYLIGRLKESDNNYEVISTFYFLQHCTNFYGTENTLLNLISKRFISSDVAESVAMRAIKVVAIISRKHPTALVDEMLIVTKSDMRVCIIEATCDLIVAIGGSEEHSAYLLQNLKEVLHLEKSFSAQKSLVEAVGAFSNVETIIYALQILVGYKGYTRFFHKEELFSTLLGKLCSIENGELIDIFEELVKIFIICACEHYRFEINALKDCFKCLNKEKFVFEKLVLTKLSEMEMLFAIESIMNESLLPVMLEHYNNNQLGVNDVKWYANRLPEDSPIYLRINEAIIAKEGSGMVREQKVDWEKIRKDGTQRYFDSLFDKGEFDHLLEELRQYYEGNILCGELLNDSFNTIPNERIDLHCIVTAILHSGLNQMKLIDFSTGINWAAFSIAQAIHILREKGAVEVNDEQKYIFAEHYTKMITITDFEKDPLGDYTIYIAKQMKFLIDRFGFDISDEKLLEFLCLPWYVFESSTSSSESETLNYIENKVQNKQKLYEKIVLNLQNKPLNEYAIQTHIFYCLENKLDNAVDIATKSFKNSNTENSYLQNIAIEYLIGIKGEAYVDNLLDEYMDEHLAKHLAVKLKTNHKNLLKLLIKRNQESNDKLLYLEELIEMNSEYALTTYIALAKERNSIPDMHANSNRVPEITHSIRNIRDVRLLEYIAELFVLSMNVGFQDNDGFGLFSSVTSVIQNLIKIDADLVKRKLKDLIKKNPNNQKLKSNCNYHLNSIEAINKQSNDMPWDVDRTLKFIEKIESRPNNL